MNGKLYDYMDWPRIEAVVYAEEASPKDVLAPRLTPDGVLIQGFFPEADMAEVLIGRKSYPMEQEDEAGYFAALIPGRRIPSYQFRVMRGDEVKEYADCYAFPGIMTQEEEKAFCAGVYYEAYRKLGAHLTELNGVTGVSFAVWAPNAMRVSVVGAFCDWDGRRLPMHRMPMSGIFELFVPGVKAGDPYKFEIKKKNGEIMLKADPYALYSEKVPCGNSIVADLEEFSWNDREWMEARKAYADRRKPLSIYETRLTEWESGEELADFAAELGYTHVELHPVMEYLEDATDGYSTFAYFAPTVRFGTPRDFQKAIDALHKKGVGVILDWCPAQFPRAEGGLERFDGTALYEVQDERMAVHPMWGTLLYNYDSPMVKDFLISNACFWSEIYHADGLRMDDVDAMLYLDYGREQFQPNIYGSNENLAAIEFLKHLNSIMKKRNPGVLLIAQEDGLWPQLTDSVENDHIGFDYKWSGGWTGDFLSYLGQNPALRKNSHDQLTLSMLYAYCEHYILTLGSRDAGTLADFMGKLPGTEEEKAAQIREAYAYMFLHPGCKMTAPGKAFSKAFGACIRDLNTLYTSLPALYEKDNEYEGFEWVQLMKYEENVIAFLRKTEKPAETLLAVCNFAAVPYENYPVGVPFAGRYKEIFNSDSAVYGGRGVGNPRMKTALSRPCDEREHSLKIHLPAFGVLVFSCTPTKKSASEKRKTASKKRN